ncbi:MAG TPA: hypothetical protein VNT99_18310 [Methylomirabilota bacterium]|nr:hypothetical protein [Methylomirabilota bacterium]
MKSTVAGKRTASQSRGASAKTTHGLTHPVIIYPFRQPDNYEDLQQLYALIETLAGNNEIYARPITVMDRKTHQACARDKRFMDFRNNTVARCSDILDAWCVDTCQMWYSALGMAHERGGANDVYWVIPGDFNYGSALGHEVLSRLHDLPEICVELEQDVCIGEIAADLNNPKHLIDTYGTFALLYIWFPQEARGIREYTERPRSEFFAMRHGFLGEMLNRRWFAYEQTVVTLLHAIFDKKHISRFFVGHVSDLPEGRESVASAMAQVERTERVLKTLWRERHQGTAGWIEQYRALDAQSEQVRRTAFTILQNLLS